MSFGFEAVRSEPIPENTHMSECLRVHIELRYHDSIGNRIALFTNQITVFQLVDSKYYIVVVHDFLSVPSVTHQCMFSAAYLRTLHVAIKYYIVVVHNFLSVPISAYFQQLT